ncbi:PNP-UDP-1 domain-containing protein [Fusarium keratoplasticum]|uniref:PNP-UDP-1 domain-containing protein n=1 Tax=Fusarium keratoplasticum TaxID=1328300 RepID=A0ACC0QFP0_9HYPO|nr:PNP-UDP-1 domain-containing protein [Fusarium keratoplasticum]KAI8652813.1 PNP-UDP-1 domain-containing protein [Fusarium keratoplasticum]
MESLLGEVRQGVKEVLHHQRNEEEENLLQWLSPIDHAKTQVDKARGRDPGTGAGKWLLDSSEFQGWLDAGNKTLFCPGIPGAGKTVLASIVIENLLGRREQTDSKPIGVAFIYLDFKQQLELVQLLGSILRQLAAHHSSALGSVKKLHDTCKAESREVYIREVRDVLHSIVPSFSRLFIVVDALDEAEHHLGEALLDEIFQVQQAYGANVFATYMTKLPRFVRQSPELQEETRTEIVKAIDGMFLLATLHLDSLVGARSMRAFRDALGSLPTGNNAYDRAYDLALERIEGQTRNRRDLAIEVLSWVACARVHLTTVQLQHALAVIVGSTHFDQSNISDMDDVVSVCAGLVVVDPGRDIVRLVHYTTQEYFERERSKRLPDAQSHITASCLAYLSLDFFQKISWAEYKRDFVPFSGYPFHEYAALNWGYHAREASALLPTVLEFLRCGNIGLSKAVLREFVFNDTIAYWGAAPTPIGLHLAAYFGLLEAVKLLADQTCLGSNDEAYRTPLSWAATNGQVEMVSYLLNTGKVDAESKCPRGRTPLHYAAGRGHVGVMEALLMIAGADINARDDRSRTPLHLAVREKQGPAVQWLLDHGADLNTKDTWDDTPLRHAVKDDNVAMMRQLLGKDQTGLSSRDDCRGLLSFAVSEGSMAAFKLLVDEYKMDVNSKDSDGRTVLLVALREELVDPTKVADFFLADSRTDLISPDCLGRTPLSYAAQNNYLVAVKLLLAKDGVDVNSRDNEGRSALSWVAGSEGRHLSIAQLLVEAGADVDSKDDKSRSILSWVVWYGHSAMAQLLVQAGIDIDAKDERGRTSLLEAAKQLHHIAIKLHEIDSEISKHNKGVCECTDQHAYAPHDREPLTSILRRYKAIFDLLVENGAGVEVRDQDGQTIESYREAERDFWSSLRDGIQDQPRGQHRECPQGYSSPDCRDTDNCFFPYW